MLQQHDLHPHYAAQVVSCARVQPDDVVVEVGAGTGALTHELLKAGARVHALEVDPQRVAALAKRFPTELAKGQLRLDAVDARRWRQPMPARWRVVANPPFALTAELVDRWLLHDDPPPHAIDLVLQREAARKLTPGAMVEGHTRSAVLVALAGVARLPLMMPREATVPPSRVDLALWSFHRAAHAPSPTDLAITARLVDIAFAGPHTVTTALRGIATAIQIRRQAAEKGWKPTDHPRHLPPSAWLPFAKLLHMCHKL